MGSKLPTVAADTGRNIKNLDPFSNVYLANFATNIATESSEGAVAPAITGHKPSLFRIFTDKSATIITVHKSSNSEKTK